MVPHVCGVVLVPHVCEVVVVIHTCGEGFASGMVVGPNVCGVLWGTSM